MLAIPLVLVAVAAACSAPAAEPESATPPDQPPAETPTINTGEPDLYVDGSSEQDPLSDLWVSFYREWTEQVALEATEPSGFANLATDPEQVISNLVAQRLDSRPVVTDFEQWPQIVVAGDTAKINDCVISTQHERDDDSDPITISTSWEAQARLTADGWRIDSAGPLDLFCVAEELNDELLGAYRGYRSAKEAAWGPPDPDHPALEQTMTGEQLTFIRGLLEDHQREGIVIREPAPTDNAVVWELGIGTATVSDCTEQVAARGAFDAESGQRLNELIPLVQTGQLDAQSVDLIRTDDGSWKVESQAGTRDTNCTQGSSRYAVR